MLIALLVKAIKVYKQNFTTSYDNYYYFLFKAS